MHALCFMPIAQTNRIFKKSDEQFRVLKEINLACDRQVAACFFKLLDMFENNTYSEQIIAKMVTNNVQFGNMISRRLIDHGFVESPDALYRAINPIFR